MRARKELARSSSSNSEGSIRDGTSGRLSPTASILALDSPAASAEKRHQHHHHARTDAKPALKLPFGKDDVLDGVDGVVAVNSPTAVPDARPSLPGSVPQELSESKADPVPFIAAPVGGDGGTPGGGVGIVRPVARTGQGVAVCADQQHQFAGAPSPRSAASSSAPSADDLSQIQRTLSSQSAEIAALRSDNAWLRGAMEQLLQSMAVPQRQAQPTASSIATSSGVQLPMTLNSSPGNS